MAPINWPDGKRFAFTAFDDADNDQFDNVRPVYDFLESLGIFTTKSVWTLAGTHQARLGGISTEDPAYLAWAQGLQKVGFEIGFHGVRGHSSKRADTELGLQRFRDQFGGDPRTMSNHFQNEDSIYWGADRLTGFWKGLYRFVQFRSRLRARGHVAESEYFWGDLCRERIRYVRNFVFRDIDTLRACPFMPYHDPEFPYVNGWYASAEGGDIESFVKMLSERNQDRLAAQGGACIMYTHFAKGFYVDGKLDERFVRLMRRLAGMGGWFVPVGTLLDWLAARNGGLHQITPTERNRLQRRWVLTKLLHGSS